MGRQKSSGLSSFPNDIKFLEDTILPAIGSGLSSFPNDIKFVGLPAKACESSGLSSFPNDIKCEHTTPLIYKDF